jgi:hypothetical protein
MFKVDVTRCLPGILDISVPGHFGTDLDISVLGTGQFGTWMRQYSETSSQSDRDDRALQRLVRRMPFATSPVLKQHWLLNKRLSTRTSAGLKSRRQFGTWMRQYSVLTTIVWYLLIVNIFVLVVL